MAHSITVVGEENPLKVASGLKEMISNGRGQN